MDQISSALVTVIGSVFLRWEDFSTMYPDNWAALQEAFIADKNKQQIVHVSTRRSHAFILREDSSEEGTIVRAGIYSFKTAKRALSPPLIPNGQCEVQKTSNTHHMDVLCYNPAVGAGQTVGVEYSLRRFRGGMVKRTCTVVFTSPLEKRDCSDWEYYVSPESYE